MASFIAAWNQVIEVEGNQLGKRFICISRLNLVSLLACTVLIYVVQEEIIPMSFLFKGL